MGQTDPRTDIYSLGLTMHYLLTGKRPGEPPYEILPITDYDETLSSGLSKVIAKATRSNPAARFQTDAEFLEMLDRYHELDAEAVAKRQRARRSCILTLALSAALFAAGVMCLITGNQMKAEDYGRYLAKSDPALIQEGIALMPGRAAGYAALLGALEKGGITAEELETFTSAVEGSGMEMDASSEEYSALMYRAGKSILTGYEGRAARDNLLAAAPFFARVSSGEGAEAAACWSALAGYIEEYAAGGSNVLSSKAPSKAAMDGIVSSMEKLWKSIEGYGGEDKDSLSIIACEVMSSTIGSLHTGDAGKGAADKLAGAMRKAAAGIAALDLPEGPLRDERDAAAASAASVVEKLTGIAEAAGKEGGQPAITENPDDRAASEGSALEL
jgi:serine/threonine-protein kinase